MQNQFDSSRKIEERRRLGQYATPIALATEIISYGLSLLDTNEIKFLEPSCGTGAFFSALLSATQEEQINSITGFEIDEEIYQIASSLWDSTFFNLFHENFLSASCHRKVNFLISNPPYVRHHLIDKNVKNKMQKKVNVETDLYISGLAGLYCYFILLSHKWLEPHAVSGWLIPSEFMDANYGIALKKYLLDKVHLLRIHRYSPEDAKFDDALVSSCVVWFINEEMQEDYEIDFTFGGTHEKPIVSRKIRRNQLENEAKWTAVTSLASKGVDHSDIIVPTLGDYFTIKRGLATGDNGFFILSKEQISALDLDMSFFTPILPSPHILKENEIYRDSAGYPQLEPQLFLLNCELSETELQDQYPSLWKYLESGRELTGKRYLCRKRKKWYFQEKRAAAPFLCSYMGRSKNDKDAPFRFILNHTDAVATNSYFMLYPKAEITEVLDKNPDYIKNIWHVLQSISRSDLVRQGRIYGGGLMKIEPRELSNVQCKKLHDLVLEMN